jgi:hypothetical protein
MAHLVPRSVFRCLVLGYAPAFVAQPDHRIEHRLPARSASPLMVACRVRHPGCRPPLQRPSRRNVVRQRPPDLANEPVSLLYGGEQRIRAVAQHVPTISNLPSQRRTLTRAFGVAAGPIARDDFGTGVCL